MAFSNGFRRKDVRGVSTHIDKSRCVDILFRYEVNPKNAQTPGRSHPPMIAMWQAVQRIEILYSYNFLGFNLGETPMSHISEWPYIVLVVILGITQYFSVEINQILMKKQKGYRPNAAMKSMK